MRTGKRVAVESFPERKARVLRILHGLHDRYPQADCALQHCSGFQLICATILSAQCTDERVNKVTPALFERYPDAAALAKAPQAEVEALIRSTGFFRNKAKNLIGMAAGLVARHGGQVPDTMEELLQLPGVARKTANVVLGTWFQKNEGIVVDTHVGRLVDRLGLLQNARDAKDAAKIELDLQPLVPRDEWTYFSHALIWHGRKVCFARKPNCPGCNLAPDCPSAALVDRT
ncbi:MAG: endonuclease III [Deltaproteobacteria bacterium]|nr:endonuclease III [Deltaproteobacteria bacterium]